MLVLSITAFVVGAVIMIFEILGSRLLAPFLGSSVLTWTVVIGTVLGFLSVGYYWGGLMKNSHKDKLSLLIFFSGLYLFLTGISNRLFLLSISNSRLEIFSQTFLSSILIYAVPSVLLGAVTPYILSISITKITDGARLAGRFYAVSTIGSIIGTFSAGFFLIPNLGSIRLIYLLAFTLAVLSLIVSKKIYFAKLLLILFSILGLIYGWQINEDKENTVADIDTSFYRVWIESSDDPAMKNIKKMYIDGAVNSVIKEGEDDVLIFPYYYKYYDLVFWNGNRLKEVLMIGGGGMTYPRYFAKRFPEINMTVVEIDPAMEKIASDLFDYKKSKSIEVVNQDGRIYLNKTEKKFDAIMIDAFSGNSLPFHLNSLEALKAMKRKLNESGVVVVNIPGSIEGSKSTLFRSVLTTYKTVFSGVKFFSTYNKKNEGKFQNLIILASDGKLSKIDSLFPDQGFLREREIKKNIAPGKLLTDDWAPTEYWSAKQFIKTNQ